ncbi:MAG: GNAT family N-acetyltransferase [Pseudomonadota bacterium]
MLDTLFKSGLSDPVAASFQASWSCVARSVGTAHVLPARMGHFADPGEGAGQDFAQLVRRENRQLILLSERDHAISNSIRQVSQLRGVQMVREADPMEAIASFRHAVLKAKDQVEMLELARRTKPGPFEVDTPRLGRFIGVREGGRLIAMAGLRMGFPGWSEISGVCVDPKFRGQGLARLLVAKLVTHLERKGVRPFLHTYADNLVAIELYRTLGFRIRTEMCLSLVEART